LARERKGCGIICSIENDSTWEVALFEATYHESSEMLNCVRALSRVCHCTVQDAEMAIASMNGQWIGGRAIRTNWANGKANANATRGSDNKPTREYSTLLSSVLIILIHQ